MPPQVLRALTLPWLAAVVLASGLSVASAQQPAGARQAMERCVSTVLTRLARRGASASDVGPAVLTRCDGPLRATLAEAIRSGQAGLCTIETCLDTARMRAAETATQLYRQRVGR
jgi:hypothetical protein